MWQNYALSLYRTLTRHRLYAALNTLGLALGIAVCTILFLVVRFERSFDRWIPGAESVYRMNLVGTWPGRAPKDGPGTQPVMMPRLLATFPQIKAGARLMEGPYIVRAGDKQNYERFVLADPSVFDVFPLPFVAGDRATALGDTSSVVLSQAMARKYFGSERAIGRRLTVMIDGRLRDYRVTGVMRDLPPNTTLVLDFVARFSPEVLPNHEEQLHRWGSAMLYSYIRLRDPSDIAGVRAGLKAFIDREAIELPKPASDMINYRLIPLTSTRFDDANTTEAFKPGVDPLFVGALGVMGAVILLIAVVNYVSLATARSGMRAREVAVRKVMGATRRALVVQFVAESVAVSCVAGLIAAAMVELALPGVSAMLGEPITMTYFGADGVALPLAGLCLMVGLAAGAYPALALSGFRPASVLASARTPGGGRAGTRAREVLAVGQFAIAITLMICTAVIFGQIQFLRSADVGFRRDGLLIVQRLGDPQVAPQMRTILEAFRATPGVISATASDRRPATGDESNGNVQLASNPAVEPVITYERIGPDYVRTYGLTMAAGRPLDMAHGLDDRMGLDAEATAARGGVNIMVNESAARLYGFKDPARMIGQQLMRGHTTSGRRSLMTVVGVVRDVRFVSPRISPPPQFYEMNSHLGRVGQASSWSAAVRVREADMPLVRQRLEAQWRRLAPGTPFSAETVQVAMKPFYDGDARRGQLFAVGAVLSAAIACLGLYGLAAFNTSRRIKEIGIRKTLGASTADVLRLLVGEFLRPVLWANLIAWPVAWFAMRSWLSGFDQRIDLNPAYFLVPSLAAVAVAVLTVAEQAIRVSRSEPARALRYE
ncbi:MAG: FtsX-like permease family protein [Phenylobacterium sp.]|uniref:ABC transporter permease n=1 Tax=Phenylobacterium sp. TaxID=1871053 RepID=UPI0012054A91|nr:ABC transporter permease [Phenylobacterium sp.]TAJ70842.1 MAG: FtsX-like permease family protein [Phenylobacterium sp.]